MPLTSDFHYELPRERIAQRPAEPRDSSRLMVLDRQIGALQHRTFRELPALLRAGDVLVINETRVVPARLVGRRPTGGRVEALLVRDEGSGVWSCLVEMPRGAREGERLQFDGFEGELLGRGADGRLRVRFPEDVRERLPRAGRMPLPPYIRRDADEGDAERYQTVYAREPGSIAAPTAGLHFTPAVFDGLREGGVQVARLTLHVGPGTFAPIKAERVEDHAFEAEPYEIPDATLTAIREARTSRRRVIAVGTTCVRVLEAVARGAPARGSTALFIYPPFEFRAVDGMLTNFHLPRGTPLLLVSALAGRERILDAYAAAVREGYRFYSYGDAMMIT